MSKRQEIRERRHRQQLRNRILVIGLVSLGALLVVFALVQSLRKNAGTGTPTEQAISYTPRQINAPQDGLHLGDPNAPVKMDVWEDFQCSGCEAYTTNIEPQVIQTYIETGKVYYTFHTYMFIDGGQGESHQAAYAALCANDQGRFWDYHDILFANWQGENVGGFSDERLAAFAEKIGLDMTAFNKCFDAKTYADQAAADMQAGVDLNVHSTPSIFVDGKLVVSSAGENYIPSFADIASAIETALQGK